MIELYFFPSPNGLKIAIMLEECGLPYEVHPINIGRGEQFQPDYLAEKSGQFLPTKLKERSRVITWLFWQVSGLGPIAGQAHHFRAFAPETVPYGIERYTQEVNRLYGDMERQLGDSAYLAGEYSIADIACWPWVVPHERQGQNLNGFPNLKCWFETIRDRPGVQRGFALGNETMMDREGYKFLYGQTAATVNEQTAGHAQKER